MIRIKVRIKYASSISPLLYVISSTLSSNDIYVYMWRIIETSLSFLESQLNKFHYKPPLKISRVHLIYKGFLDYLFFLLKW